MRKKRIGFTVLDYILAVVLLLCFTRIDYLYEALKMTKFLMFVSMAALAFSALMLLVTILRKRKISLDVIWLLLFFGYLFLITAISRRDVLQCLETYSGAIGLCFTAYYYIVNGKLRIFLNAFIVLEILIYLNLLTTFIYPDGMYNTSLYTQNWLLGYKNPQIRIILPVLGISMIRSFEKNNRIGRSSVILFVCSLVTMLRVGSSTGILSIILFGILVFVFIILFNTRPKWLSLRNVSIVFLILNLGILFLNLQTWFQSLFQTLGKDETFTGRNLIWGISLSEISKHLILGHGFLTGAEYVGIYYFSSAYHPHNYLLYILMQGGLVLLGIFAMGLIYGSKQLKKNKSISCTMIILIIISLLFVGLTESLTGNNFLYMFIILGMHSDAFKAACSPERLLNRVKIKVTI